MSKRFVPLTDEEKKLVNEALEQISDRMEELRMQAWEIDGALEREDREHLVKMGILLKGENG